jgi:hypothetical protein
MQKTIALSTEEAEYYSASEFAVEIIDLRNLIRNMGLLHEDDTSAYEDNTAHIEWGNHINKIQLGIVLECLPRLGCSTVRQCGGLP